MGNDKVSENEIKVVKSPVVPLDMPDESMATFSNQFTYYVRLSTGIIVTKPEDFPDNEYEVEIKEEEIIDD
jgi:hypothetical protein